MTAFWHTIGGALGYVFKPEIKTRRLLREGVTRTNFVILGIVTLAMLVPAVALTGQTFSLYLPHYYGWQWVDITVLQFPAWLWLGFWAIAAGLCLVPRITAIAIGVFFSLYYLYAAVNGATIRLLDPVRDYLRCIHRAAA